jgi:large subunit ribosomal protein L1
MAIRSKRYRALIESAGVDLKSPHPVPTAVGLVKKLAKAKFTESIELAVHLNLDTKKTDQQFRGSFSLPHGTGRDVRVIVFVDDGDKLNAALAAGAVKAGGDDLVAEVTGGFMDFDIAVSTPKMMRSVGKLGKVLGPRGLMPNPKVGTVTMDVAAAVKASKGGAVEFRVEKAGIIQGSVGKASFGEEQLAQNIRAFVDAVAKAKPAGSKGTYLQRAAISSTMGPGVKLDLATLATAGAVGA